MTLPPEALLAAKLALVAASVLLSSLVARRFGHGAGGVLAGMPMIAGPITGLLLIDVAAPAVRAVCLATLACQPALMAYFVAFAHAAHWRRSWWSCLGLALAVFFAAGTLLLALPLTEPARIALALSSPLLGALAMPRPAPGVYAMTSVSVPKAADAVGADDGVDMARTGSASSTGVTSAVIASTAASRRGDSSLPRAEMACRVGVAIAVAAGVMWGAKHLGPGPAGLLLAAPITGMVLPSFTLPRHGPVATTALLGGFVRGQAGFVIFFVLMLGVLPTMHAGLGWLLAMFASGLLPWTWVRMRRRAAA